MGVVGTRLPGEIQPKVQGSEEAARRELRELRNGIRDKSLDPKANSAQWISRYTRFIESHAGTQAADDARISLAWRLHDSGSDDRALGSLSEVEQGGKPSTRAKAIAARGYLLQALGRADEAVELLKEASRSYSGTEHAAMVKVSLAWAYLRCERPDLASATFHEIEVERALPPRIRLESRFNEALVKKELLRRATYLNPDGSRKTLDVVEQTNLLNEVRMSLENVRDSARHGLVASISRSASIQDGGGDDLADQAAYELGLVLLSAEQWLDAGPQFESVISSPTAAHDLVDAATVALAATYFQEGNLSLCISTANKVLQEPDASVANATFAGQWQSLAFARLTPPDQTTQPPNDGTQPPSVAQLPTIFRGGVR